MAKDSVHDCLEGGQRTGGARGKHPFVYSGQKEPQRRSGACQNPAAVFDGSQLEGSIHACNLCSTYTVSPAVCQTGRQYKVKGSDVSLSVHLQRGSRDQ